jgi:hypothetical protein
MKALLPLFALLLAGCHNASVKEETFTITEHVAATDSNPERYTVQHESGIVITVLQATCSYTLYEGNQNNPSGLSLSGFCPLERLPSVGRAVARCTSKSLTGTGSPPCMSHTGNFLVIHEGGLWGNDTVASAIEWESVKH